MEFIAVKGSQAPYKQPRTGIFGTTVHSRLAEAVKM
jgi:hypothetical protein